MSPLSSARRGKHVRLQDRGPRMRTAPWNETNISARSSLRSRLTVSRQGASGCGHRCYCFQWYLPGQAPPIIGKQLRRHMVDLWSCRALARLAPPRQSLVDPGHTHLEQASRLVGSHAPINRCQHSIPTMLGIGLPTTPTHLASGQKLPEPSEPYCRPVSESPRFRSG